MIDPNTLNPLLTGPWSVAILIALGGVVVALLGLVVHRMGRRSSAAQRHAILVATVLGLLILPVIRLIAPEVLLEVLPASAADVGTAVTPIASSAGSGVAVPSTASPITRTIGDQAGGRSPSMPVLVATLYVAGFVLLMFPVLIGTLRMIWLTRHATLRDESDAVLSSLGDADRERRLRVLISDRIRVPLAWGWRQGLILLPAEFEAWPPEMQRDSLLHELAHLERQDLLFQTLARLAAALHWFNPLAWRVLRCLLLEAEQACDDRVLGSGTSTADYAERLLRIASGADHAALRQLPAVAMARSSQLATRIESLFEPRRHRAFRIGRVRLMVTILLVLLPTALVGVVRLGARPVEDPGDGGRRPVLDRLWYDDGDADHSPLYAAIRGGDTGTVESLLDGGADPNARWRGDGTPLIIAVREQREDIVESLLAHGARPDLGVEGDGNALIVAAERGDVDLLRRFLSMDVDVNRGVPGDGNPLIAAASVGDVEAMRLLVDHGADVEVVVPGDENALITASAQGQMGAVRYLVSIGANVNARVPVESWRHGNRQTEEIRTPLSVARRNGFDEIVQFLRSAGARE